MKFTEMPVMNTRQSPDRLLKTINAILQAKSPEALITQLFSAAFDISGCEIARLYTLDRVNNRFILLAQKLIPELELRPSLMPPDTSHTLLRRCIDINQVFSGDDVATPLDGSNSRWSGTLYVPLPDSARRIRGVLVCAARDVKFGSAVVSGLEELSELVAGPLWNTRPLAAHRMSHNNEMSAPAFTSLGAYGLIGSSCAMQKIYRLIARSIRNTSSILLIGEPGTGKKLVAKTIHEHGPRRHLRFASQSCCLRPAALLEQTLFGSQCGTEIGLLNSPDIGTLYLEDIAELPGALQRKLVQLLESRSDLGRGRALSCATSARLIAGTTRPLDGGRKVAINDALLRLISTQSIGVDPLRERKEDIQTLAWYFANQAAGEIQRSPVDVSSGAIAELHKQSFAGNISELRSLIERALLTCDGSELTEEHLRLEQGGPTPDPVSYRALLEKIERNLLLDYLRQYGGNQSKTARALGLPRRTLLYRMERLNICSKDI